MPQAKKDSKALPSTMISNPNFQRDQKSAYDIGIEALAKLIASNKIDIKNICVQFDESWHTLSNNILLNVIKNSTKEEINTLFTTLVENQSIFFKV